MDVLVPSVCCMCLLFFLPVKERIASHWVCHHMRRQIVSILLAVPSPESSSFLILMIIGIISGVIFIFLLHLFCCYRKSRGSTDDQRVSQVEDQQQVYSSLLHGDRCVYESIRWSKNTENGLGHGSSREAHTSLSPPTSSSLSAGTLRCSQASRDT